MVGQCNKPSNVMPIVGGQYQVVGTPVCLTPDPITYTCEFKACGPTIGIDCEGNLIVKTKYDGWYLCTGTGSWEALELETCPLDITMLYYDPDHDPADNTGFWWIRGDSFYVYTETGWTQRRNLPCGIRPVQLNTRTGEFFTYKPCDEHDFREVIATNPFCTTGYGR